VLAKHRPNRDERPFPPTPDVLEGRIEPGRVFDRVIGLDEVLDGYRAMNEREAIKVLIEF
jgi:threonine dehydrogenase-like Zn-dependent dehydrogenase